MPTRLNNNHSVRVTYHKWPLSMTQTFDRHIQYSSTSRVNQSLPANAGFQNRGVYLQAFPSFPSPPPSFIFWLSFHFSRGQNRSFFAPKPMETLSSTQAISFTFFPLPLIFTSHWWPLAFLILSPRPQNFHVTLPTKKCLFCFLSLALDLCRPFSRWASLAAAYFHFFSVLLLLYIPNLWTMNRRLIL